MSFESLSLAPEILRAVLAEGYTIPTPIQAQAIPHLLAGRDLLGCAQTGTGKTAAFALPILHRLSTTKPKQQPEPARGEVTPSREGRFHDDRPQHGHMLNAFSRTRHAPKHRRPTRALILSPTRELASQIADSLDTYGRNTRLRFVTVYGGVSQGPQVRMLQQGVDIIIATPGRLVDLIQQGWIDISTIEMFVLDEADRMLDMGFLPDLKRISDCLPSERQTLLFSATMPDPIQRLADQILRNPAHVKIAPEKATTELIEQQVYHVAKGQKADLLTGLLQRPDFSRVIVFTQTKHGADRVCKQLDRANIRSEAIHGNKSQNARQRALNAFKSNQIQVLVATDVAARGIDVDNITHVIQFDLPNEPETYVHRIGRTGRAGAAGLAISFCDQEQRTELRDIERLINRRLDVQKDHPDGVEVLQAAQVKSAPANPPGKFRFGGAVRNRKPFGKSSRGPASNGGDRSAPPREGRPSSFGGDRPQKDRPQGDRPSADQSRSRSERPFGAERPQRSSESRSGESRPSNGPRPQGDRPAKSFGGASKFKFKSKRRPATAGRG
ncbi:ATP-dependent RNA helicase RhlE [Anatilimnocola aggregata]|uniref:ATP-dependent RNA helicase RhlE n=1 Tax=Anatilimnocola aggregata TaxID=2528021 RepID=A0A517YKH3_9BACT|nr:DEAD/DEAH box helicase [Anatilimnocola aggregata]QDU30719.1 ATP-dependent RNA helicase RhlE [Anatilimnocola aggregata]